MDFKEFGKKLAEEMWPLLEDKLDFLQVEGQEMRTRARNLLELQTEALFLVLSGKDASLVQMAIESSVQSLKAAGSIVVVRAIREFVMDGLKQMASAVLSIL